jgi:homoaconitase/3-isopropylmalate dehydratase large subunit
VNMVEKVLARACGRERVEVGQVVVANVDTLLLHDLSCYLTAQVFEEEVRRPMRHPDRVVVVFDHHFSPPNERQAHILELNRAFVRRHGTHLFDCGSGNIHHVGVRHGFVRPGTVVVGSDSHTPVHGTLGCFATGLGNNSHAATVMPFGKAWLDVPPAIEVRLSGRLRPGVTPRDVSQWLIGRIGEGGAISKALAFTGPFVEGLEIWDRWLLPLITVDVGATCGYIEPDEKTVAFVRALTDRPFEVLCSDPGTRYEDVLDWDVGELEPQVACPPTVGNVKPVGDAAGAPIQWAELGGHGGGRLEDFRMADRILAGRHIAPGVKLNLVPSSRTVFAEALAEGLVDRLFQAGGTWFPPSTGSNQAINMGAMDATETMISAHARNFPGRNGSPEAKMYLGSALTVAASALKGVVSDPREFLPEARG